MNTLLFKIVCTVTIGSIILAAALSLMYISFAKRTFAESFSASQEKIFDQIDQDFYELYGDLVDISSEVSENKNLQNFLMGKKMSGMEDRNNRFLFEKQLQQTKLSEYTQFSVFVISKHQNTYIYSNSDAFAVPLQDIWNSSAADSARNHFGEMICQYRSEGFTNVNCDEPVVILAKAWSYHNEPNADAILFISIREKDILDMYDHFTSESSDIVLLNQDNQVISSNNSQYFKQNSTLQKQMSKMVEQMQENNTYCSTFRDFGGLTTYFMQKIHGTNYLIVGTINPNEAFFGQFSFWMTLLMVLVVTIPMIAVLNIISRQLTRPLRRLAETMRNARNTNFSEHVKIEGTNEIQELSQTYNWMMDELNNYIGQLISIEEEKRAAEIRALQMQINPHYIYNTLASIKWLVWQGNADSTTKVIDAFISLLRNVISNSDEFVTVEQEIENLKNYTLINRARYGEAVKVEFFVIPQYSQMKVPKLILQPFVENAFFHAFPEGRSGSIQIFVRGQGEDQLRFDIVDDGIGITKERLEEIRSGMVKKKDHFSGIGMGNVDDRIKLIYGMDYGINIKSQEGKGTTVTLILPKKQNLSKEN